MATSLLRPFGALFRPRNPFPTSTTTCLNQALAGARQTSTPFSTSAAAQARNDLRQKKDMRITLIRYHLTHPLTPRPLRLSRMRSLRHWTIHRAWLLQRRARLQAEERELERVYNSMREACEELRTGAGDGGRLFRVAMSKKGVWGGVPVEYARLQTDGPAREGWNHAWTR